MKEQEGEKNAAESIMLEIPRLFSCCFYLFLVPLAFSENTKAVIIVVVCSFLDLSLHLGTEVK